tara:strand:- start:1035 stop:1778 length:744 start_codon:yes stop_codon:yes gene_type:complete
MNIKEIVQIPYTMNPRFKPVADVVLKEYTDDLYNERNFEFQTLADEMCFESDIAKKECLVEKTSRAMQLTDEPFFDIIDMGLEIPDDVIIMHKGKVEAGFVAMASGWNPSEVAGMTLAEVHEAVADSEMLRKASDGIWRAMTSGSSYERYTWGISPLESLSNHPSRHRPNFNKIDDLYFRVEHERTLTVDKDTAAFFIDVEVHPLSSIFYLKHEYKDLIKDSINSMTDNVLQYKNLVKVKELINESN